MNISVRWAWSWSHGRVSGWASGSPWWWHATTSRSRHITTATIATTTTTAAATTSSSSSSTTTTSTGTAATTTTTSTVLFYSDVSCFSLKIKYSELFLFLFINMSWQKKTKEFSLYKNKKENILTATMKHKFTHDKAYTQQGWSTSENYIKTIPTSWERNLESSSFLHAYFMSSYLKNSHTPVPSL